MSDPYGYEFGGSDFPQEEKPMNQDEIKSAEAFINDSSEEGMTTRAVPTFPKPEQESEQTK